MHCSGQGKAEADVSEHSHAVKVEPHQRPEHIFAYLATTREGKRERECESDGVSERVSLSESE